VPATSVRVLHRFRDGGMEGLVDGRRENGIIKADDDLRQALAEMLQGTPQDLGWNPPTWTQELMAEGLERACGVEVSVTTVARMLRGLGARWGMARPVVACPWGRSRKQRRLQQIQQVLERLGPRDVAFYEDEVDIHLNPKIGRDWTLPLQQRRILTPGKNQKRYLAGALAVDGGELAVVEGERKTADLFLRLLVELRRRHPKARHIHVVLDNYGIHSAQKVRTYLQHAGRCFVLHFLPPYCPDHNRIERLWRELHANDTRNHRCRSMKQLMDRVHAYLASEDRRRRGAPPGHLAGLRRAHEAA
jgi:transposase